MRRKKDRKLREELKKVDPLLATPTQSIEQNVENGIDDMVPDPDDIPGGFNPNQTARPNLIDADGQAVQEEKE